MGVTQLWQILAPVEEHRPLTYLQGQTLAVDLSIWVCETQSVKQMQGVVSKPFLRNLYFRISHLTQLGVKLVFVIEGSAPELKWDTMLKRQQARFPGRQGKPASQKSPPKPTRRNFNSWLKECCELLEILGIPYIQSKGEAEALCALLNAAGLVDGCLTNDGDAFLYGATTVYRNFTMNSKDPHVEMYRLSDIQEKLGIDRGGLVALGLLIGCDFVPKGVPGIGIANAVRLLQALKGKDVLLRLQSWSTMSEHDCVDQAEVLARRKAIQVPDFPQIKVIDEFLVAKDRCPSRLPEWKRPFPAKFQEFALIKMEWPVEYTMEKVLPLLTLWDMQDLIQSKNPSTHQHLKPHRIVKTRVRQGEACYEVEWIKPVTDTVYDGSYYVTIEAQDLFSKCYPDVVKAFLAETTESKKKPKAKKKKKKTGTSPATSAPTLDNLSFQFEKVNLGQVTTQLQQSVNNLQPSFAEYESAGLVSKAKQPRHLTLSPKKSPEKNRKPESRKGSTSVNSSVKSAINFGERVSEEDEAFVPLSQRVKLRMQNKQENNKENDVMNGKCKNSLQENAKVHVSKGPYMGLDNMSSLLEDIQNLSLKEQDKFRHKMKGTPVEKLQVSDYLGKSPVTVCRNNATQNVQKMSSPLNGTFCSPATYLKHKGNLEDSFTIQKNPYYIESPVTASKPKSTGNDIYSPGFFSRKEKTLDAPEDTHSAAQKLAMKLESGIMSVGNKSEPKIDKAADDKFDIGSLMSVLNGSQPKVVTPMQKVNVAKTFTPVNQSIGDLDKTSLSQFGDFDIQHSLLLNSLCSSLMQALTPKGVTLPQEEYEKLISTINEIDSDRNSETGNDCEDGENELVSDGEIVCNIDFKELEKASSGLKNLNQKLLLRPIQIDDEDVMSKLSKSARKKLRRRERKREMENSLQAQSAGKNSGGKKNTGNTSVQGKHSKQNKSKVNNDSISIKGKDVSTVVNSVDKPKKCSKQNLPVTNETSKTGKYIDNSKLSNESQSNTQNLSQQDSKVLKQRERCTKSSNTKISENETPKQSEIQQELSKSEPQVAGKEPKTKKRKKKIKKASPVIDLSANDSVLDDKQVELCADYLRRAIQNSQKQSSSGKIEKASPFMNISMNDTLLELEGLSCKVTGEELEDDLNLMLKKKKRLSKEKILLKDVKVDNSGETKHKPVLSINSLMRNTPVETESASCNCGITAGVKEADDHSDCKIEEGAAVKDIQELASEINTTRESPNSYTNTIKEKTDNMPSSEEIVANSLADPYSDGGENVTKNCLFGSDSIRESNKADAFENGCDQVNNGDVDEVICDTNDIVIIPDIEDKANIFDSLNMTSDRKEVAPESDYCREIKDPSCDDEYKKLTKLVADKEVDLAEGNETEVLPGKVEGCSIGNQRENTDKEMNHDEGNNVEILWNKFKGDFNGYQRDNCTNDVVNTCDLEKMSRKSEVKDKSYRDKEHNLFSDYNNTDVNKKCDENGIFFVKYRSAVASSSSDDDDNADDEQSAVENKSKREAFSVKMNRDRNLASDLECNCQNSVCLNGGSVREKMKDRSRLNGEESWEKNGENSSINNNQTEGGNRERELNGNGDLLMENVFDHSNRDLDLSPAISQSPVCLADRLKLKLRKASTRDVLDAFTQGK